MEFESVDALKKFINNSMDKSMDAVGKKLDDDLRSAIMIEYYAQYVPIYYKNDWMLRDEFHNYHVNGNTITVQMEGKGYIYPAKENTFNYDWANADDVIYYSSQGYHGVKEKSPRTGGRYFTRFEGEALENAQKYMVSELREKGVDIE